MPIHELLLIRHHNPQILLILENLPSRPRQQSRPHPRQQDQRQLITNIPHRDPPSPSTKTAPPPSNSTTGSSIALNVSICCLSAWNCAQTFSRQRFRSCKHRLLGSARLSAGAARAKNAPVCIARPFRGRPLRSGRPAGAIWTSCRRRHLSASLICLSAPGRERRPPEKRSRGE